LQRHTQFVETHQHPAFVLQADDLLLEPLEERLRGAAGKLVPVDAGGDGPLEFLAAQVPLGVGHLQQTEEAEFFHELFHAGGAGHAKLGWRWAAGGEALEGGKEVFTGAAFARSQ